MYVSNLGILSGSGTITKLNLANGAIIKRRWVSNLNGPFGLAINGKNTKLNLANIPIKINKNIIAIKNIIPGIHMSKLHKVYYKNTILLKKSLQKIHKIHKIN